MFRAYLYEPLIIFLVKFGFKFLPLSFCQFANIHEKVSYTGLTEQINFHDVFRPFSGDIIKSIAPIVDGGGGGRPQLAQAGGKNPGKIDEALRRASEIILEKLQT